LNNWIEKQGRCCFLQNKVQTVFFPVFKTQSEIGEDIKPTHVIEKGQHTFIEEETDVEGIYRWLRLMEDFFPSMPAFEALQTYLRPVCIESLIDPLVYHFFALENAVSEYGVEALFLPKDYFDIFEMIRSSSNLFENLENFKRESELKNNAINSKSKR